MRDFHFKINFLLTRDLLLRLDIYHNFFKIQEKNKYILGITFSNYNVKKQNSKIKKKEKLTSKQAVGNTIFNFLSTFDKLNSLCDSAK